MNAYVFHARAGMVGFSAEQTLWRRDHRCSANPPTTRRDNHQMKGEPVAYTSECERRSNSILERQDPRLGSEPLRRRRIARSDRGSGRESVVVGAIPLIAAARLLAPHVAGRRVVGMGCGSGLLAEPVLAAGAALPGIRPLRGQAIDRAEATRRQCAARRGDAVCRRHRHRSAAQGDALVVSLGLIEWLIQPNWNISSSRPKRVVPTQHFGTAPFCAAHPSRLCPFLLWTAIRN